MIPLRVAELAAVLGGSVHGDGGLVVDGTVETDSRLVEPGAIFFALPGTTSDGHDFAAAAVAAGAALVVAERPVDVAAPVVVVPDGVAALSDLAREVVARVRSLGRLRVVGITGSNGKTTTKNLLRAILAPHGATVAPPGSFNNHVGAPVSMLRVDAATEFLVVEMGASAPGAIAKLVSLAVPDISVVLKVGLAHVGGFGGIDTTEREKAQIVAPLPAGAVAILNADDARVARMAEATAARVVRFGLGDGVDLAARDVVSDRSGTRFVLETDGRRFEVRLRILGEHHVANALAALAVARELGVPLDAAIDRIGAVERAERWRMELLERGDGVTVVNDAYNASPDSTAAALRTLAHLTRAGGRSVAVLGEMAELGEHAAEEHDRIGRLAVRLNIARLVVVGEAARPIHLAAGLEGSWDGESVFVSDADAAYDLLSDELRPGDLVLVKSSKSAGLRFLGDRLGGVAGS